MATRRRRDGTPRVSRETREWLEEHTMEDMKELVCELYSEGEDVSELVGVTNKLEEIAEKELGEHQDLTVPTPDGTRKRVEV